MFLRKVGEYGPWSSRPLSPLNHHQLITGLGSKPLNVAGPDSLILILSIQIYELDL